jgi:hypothetical protein
MIVVITTYVKRRVIEKLASPPAESEEAADTCKIGPGKPCGGPPVLYFAYRGGYGSAHPPRMYGGPVSLGRIFNRERQFKK